MPTIEIQRVPGLPKERLSAPDGMVFSEWLNGQNLHRDVRIHINGRELSDDESIDFLLKKEDEITIFDQPKGGGFLKGSAVILGMFTYKSDLKMLSKIMSTISGQQNASTGAGSKTSSNNSLKGQTNLARNGEAKPDNFGQVRAFPDLIQESLFEYIDNKKYITEFMNFGLGRYDVSSVRYSETNLGSLAGSQYTIYNPGDVIGQITEPYLFDGVDGQEVPGKNESQDTPAESATTNTVTSAAYAGGQILVVIPKNSVFDYFMGLSYPRAINFTLNVTYTTPSGSVTKDVTLSGNLVSATETNNGATPPANYRYNFTITDITGDVSQYLPSATINKTVFKLIDNAALVIGPFVSPVNSTQVWVHTTSDLGPTDGSTDFIIKCWAVDDDNNQIPGTLQQISDSIDNPYNITTKSYFRTYKFTPAYGLAKYAVSIERTNNSNSANKLTLEAVHAINVRTGIVYPEDTLVKVTIRGTERPTSSQERKYNALITRHVISYDSVLQRVDYTLRPSRKFADTTLFNWVVRGGQPESSIDIYGLYQIQAQLDAVDARLAYFDYTFDDEDVSLGQRIQSICDAAGVTVYWDDGVLSFTLDSKRTRPVTVFNRANTKADSYSLSYEMTLPGGYDGVEVQYRDPNTNKQAFVRYRVRNGQIEIGMPTKAKKFSMLYVRNAFQADNRAQKECRRLIYSRITAGITAMADGEWINIGDMVQVPDTYDTNQQAGYVVSRSGDVFESSERINFNGNMFVVITDENGDATGRYPATPRDDTAFGFIAQMPDIDLNIFDGVDVQSPSRYVIATVEELDATQWTVTEKQPNSDGTTALTLAEYSDLIYP